MTSLEDIRKEIDRIDRELLTLMTARAKCSLAVAEVKKADAARDNTQQAPVFYRPEREAQILRKVAELNQGPMDDATVIRVFREIISSSLALEELMAIGYLGPEGTFTHSATLKHFGSSVITVPCADIDEIFRSAESGATRFGVVPVENSTEGMVNYTLDRIAESRLRICGECRIRVEHNLLSLANNRSDVRSVHAHPQALAQCRKWLDKNLPGVSRVSESSNAAAAEKVRSDASAAAIAGHSASELYELHIVERNIEDVADNTTRFFVIGDMDVPQSGNDSTSLLISAPHKPGGLRRMLEPLENAGVSMTRIESRPSRTNLWEYHFFVDVQGHQHDELMQDVLRQLREEAQYLRVLGSYPSALA